MADHTQQAYESLINKFDDLLGNCDPEVVAVTDCLNASRGKSGERCAAEKSSYARCQKARTERTNTVVMTCSSLYKQYELCMAKGEKDCVVDLARLYNCAEDIAF